MPARPPEQRRSIFEPGRDFWAGAIVAMCLAGVFAVDQFNRGNDLLAALGAAAFAFFAWRLLVTIANRKR